MNSFDNDKLRAIELARARLANARSDVERWRSWSQAIKSTAQSAIHLGFVADAFAGMVEHENAREAGEFLEREISNTFAKCLGVDLVAAIKVEADPPVVHEGGAVYYVRSGAVQVLPAGFDVRPVNAGPAWSMTEPEAITAFEAIGRRRLMAKCLCAPSLAYVCARCVRLAKLGDVDRTIFEANVVARWARIAVKRRRVKCCR